jgi:hypothetical protein
MKKEAKKIFREEMGVPKPGSGTTDDGNTAGRFLSSLLSLFLQ